MEKKSVILLELWVPESSVSFSFSQLLFQSNIMIQLYGLGHWEQGQEWSHVQGDSSEKVDLGLKARSVQNPGLCF